MIITYDPQNGLSMPDTKWLNWIETISNDSDDIIVGSELPINLIRLKIVDCILNHEIIQFKFNDQIMSVNEFGVISHYPQGFCDINVDIIQKILTKSIKNRKEKK